MAYDLQARFQKLKVVASPPLNDSAFQETTPSLDDEYDLTTAHSTCDVWDDSLAVDLTYEHPNTGQPAGARLALSPRSKVENYAYTPPIDVPSHNHDGLAFRRHNMEPLHKERYHEPSPLQDFLQKRRTSITFNPEVILETGHRRALEAPLPKLVIKTRPRGRSLLQEIAKRTQRSPFERVQSEADRVDYDPVIEQRDNVSVSQTCSGRDRKPVRGHIRQYSFQPTVDESTIIEDADEFKRRPSLTSQATTSPSVEEVRTPSDGAMECLISPIQLYSPFSRPTSLDESSAWPKSRRRPSTPRAKSFTIERNGSLRQSRRSNSRRMSSLSPATAFLSKWGREEAVSMPDDEGQEVGEYVLGKEVGFGGFSIVRKAHSLEGEERICRAVKIVRRQIVGKEETENDRLQADFEHEVGLWRCLSHRHILSLMSVHITDFATYCFTRLSTGGTLFDLVKANRQGLQKDLARRYAYQLASAIRYLHEDVRVVHRDIKLENCLIDFSEPHIASEGGNLLLCDFGLAEFIVSDDRSVSPDPYGRQEDETSQCNVSRPETRISVKGTLQYASPELIISPTSLLNPTVDIWAFGVVVYALVLGDLPFQHALQSKVQSMIEAGEWNEEGLRDVEDRGDVADLLHGCLCKNWDERWVIATVLECRWLNGCVEMLEEISSNRGWRL
ncbi:hypothetical protein MMC14_006500 [Varicellaria rhodocarpa]|nr:hypothetical protein [Varicellaria rhodocarpa]